MKNDSLGDIMDMMQFMPSIDITTEQQLLVVTYLTTAAIKHVHSM